jgi:hypothetical protein
MRTSIKDRDQASKEKLAEVTGLSLRLLQLSSEKAGHAAEADLRDLKDILSPWGRYDRSQHETNSQKEYENGTGSICITSPLPALHGRRCGYDDYGCNRRAIRR